MPILRKIYPALIANELLGIQPLSGPTGFIYSLTNRLVGSATNGLTKPGTNDGLNGPALYNKNNAGTQIVLLDTLPVVGQGITISTGVLTGAAYVPGADEGQIVYAEPTPHGGLGSNSPAGQSILNSVGGDAVGAQGANFFGALIELPANTYFGKIGTLKVMGNVVGAYTGLAAWDKILPNYSGSYVTADGETKGTLGNEMNEIGIAVERTQVEAKTRKLRAEYTIEMYQDLKAMHGVLADQELMSLMGYEIKAETDREIVDFVNSRAGLESDFYMSGGYGAAGVPANLNAGRWEIERYRALGIKIADMSRNIGRLNKRGAANKLLVSPKVLTALEAIGGFTTAPVDSTVNGNSLNPVAGRFDNKYNIVVDQYADQGEYVTAIYKGSNQDSLGVYAPYTPVSIQKVTHISTGQPALIAMTKYGLAENPWGGSNYATTMGINFESTVLA